MIKTKSILGIIVAVCLLVPAMFFLTACNQNNDNPTSDRMMSLSVNPKVTFVVNDQNKITSVSYENDDAGTIYADINFENMNVNDAIKTFIERATISGHIGLTADGEANEFVIEVSGSIDKDVESLQKLAKEKVQSVFETLGIEANVKITEFTNAQMKSGLVATAQALYPEKTLEELNALTNDELIKLIETKHQEYKNLTYDKIKDIQAQVREQMQDPTSALGLLKSAIDNAQILLDQAQTALKNAQAQGIDVTALQTALDQAKANLETAINNYNEQIQSLITEAEQNIATQKDKLHEDFKKAVSASSDNLIEHLNKAKIDGKITEAQYNNWVNMINANKPQSPAQ